MRAFALHASSIVVCAVHLRNILLHAYRYHISMLMEDWSKLNGLRILLQYQQLPQQPFHQHPLNLILLQLLQPLQQNLLHLLHQLQRVYPLTFPRKVIPVEIRRLEIKMQQVDLHQLLNLVIPILLHRHLNKANLRHPKYTNLLED